MFDITEKEGSYDLVLYDDMTDNSRMALHVKTMIVGKDIEIFVHPQETILSIKYKIQERNGSPIDDQRLIFSSIQLIDERTLGSYNFLDGATLHFMLRLRGMISTFTTTEAEN